MYAGSQGMHALLVGLYCSLGQNLVYVGLYLGGDWLINRWRWLKAKVDTVRQRFQGSSGAKFRIVTIVGGLFGIPPIVAMVALAPAFQVPLKSVLLITLSCRWIRFSVLAAFGPVLLEWLQPLLVWLGWG